MSCVIVFKHTFSYRLFYVTKNVLEDSHLLINEKQFSIFVSRVIIAPSVSSNTQDTGNHDIGKIISTAVVCTVVQ